MRDDGPGVLQAASETISRATELVQLEMRVFRAELSEEVTPVRDASGQVDIQGTMQVITSVIEGWIREYPEQWLWLHRRWR